VIPVLFLAAAGFFAGGAMTVVRRGERTRRVWFAGVLLATVSALCIGNALVRM